MAYNEEPDKGIKISVSKWKTLQVLTIGLLLLAKMADAGEADVIEVAIERTGGNTYHFDVTVRHDDEGWNHYADRWEVIAADGTVLVTRTLYHPHVNEQPFTRSLSDFYIPSDKKIIIVEAHDKVNGWSPNKVRIDMGRSSGDNYQIEKQ